MSSTERDTYKYQLEVAGKVILRDITYDLVRREVEHNKEHPSARVVQVGQKTTREDALKWLRRQRRGNTGYSFWGVR